MNIKTRYKARQMDIRSPVDVQFVQFRPDAKRVWGHHPLDLGQDTVLGQVEGAAVVFSQLESSPATD